MGILLTVFGAIYGVSMLLLFVSVIATLANAEARRFFLGDDAR